MRPIRKREVLRAICTLAIGMFLGGLLTRLAESFLPASAARSFLTSSVTAMIGPFYVDLVAVTFTIGPVSFVLNVLTLVGIVIVAVIVRSWL
ncbi:MAG: hypothetical protein F4187_04165 [Gemmatimonadetes bacterium]|nr:hypothetical protein [Gemmatimonadota bacterium]MYI07681.1 hypothetical protein [Gemmatimonadota bacterium]